MIEFLVCVAGYVIAVLCWRRVRAARGLPKRHWSEDATDVVYMDSWPILLAAAIAVACAMVLFLGFDLPLWLSFGAPVALGAVYCCYRYPELFKR
ncbi:hypothetical protein [Verminephrobacter aporrectodeae]|uniref:Uncharacterized protein n=1 Tax=Verminephrobacter aporrectodeae subsp. tuberculatae TaxID=1110392 RepID=A0ABT3KYB4_9BURK|nr:hypothetical protein [Verminephrobacter aporrectodeae]MCW5223478.1 hypothetical protein [Verminephrobacter aporrectodeae subsp. tuberculatae]MCW5288942.1 hypothetical protein [Verminephrobacter aporrectodeae subsp. tuberculatae]MCW5323328.1 hypothetical protein [Verminephrobacter aporrectodeae subsp. tuberculatae]MCW8174338.1 hypothetical protein [Verminephrobacter aporrectodeae subsp. tuberculatae]MCW8202118.1 hypothetical protein [Verminephrobacter aporrectodeae subsp. tuberculatae]